MTQTLSRPAASTLPPFQAIADLVRQHTRARPMQTAVVQGQRSVTWAQLDAMVDRVAASLQRDGVQPGESISVCAANSLEYVAVFLGGLRAGAAVAPLSTHSSPQQLETMAADCGARTFFVDGDVPAFQTAARRIFMDGTGSLRLRDWLQPEGRRPRPVAVTPDAPFNIIYSSGTTGTPKGIVQPHGMRWSHVARAESYSYGPEAVTLIATSLCSNTTLVCFFPTLARAARWCWHRRNSTPAASWSWRKSTASATRCWCRCNTSGSWRGRISTTTTCRRLS